MTFPFLLCYNIVTSKGSFFYAIFALLPTKKAGFVREAKKSVYGGAVMRVKITLACTECKQRNYNTMKNKKNDPDRLEMKKYCRFCRKETLHRETK